MNKKYLWLLPAFLLSLYAIGYSSYAQSFEDVARNHPYFDAITFSSHENIVQGYPDGTFGSSNTINRAEFTKIIVEAVYPGEASGSNCFPDVTNEWFAEYICFAQSKGIIAGYPDGTFKPINEVSFAEAAKIIVNAYDYSFDDHEVWFVPYLDVLVAKRAIPEDVSEATKLISRGEMVEMIYRLQNGITYLPSKMYLSDDYIHFVASNVPYGEIDFEARSKISEDSCTIKDFSMAFVLIRHPETKAFDNALSFLEKIKDQMPDAFLFATDGLATLDTSSDIEVIDYRSEFVDGAFLNAQEIAREFYKNRPDDYDFLTVYTAFDIPGFTQTFSTVRNDIQGIGFDTYNYDFYGNTKRLRGVISNVSLDNLPPDHEVRLSLLNGILHETNHSWCCFAGGDYTGDHNESLGITRLGHFYNGVHHPYIHGGPLRTSHWRSNGDGTFALYVSPEVQLNKLHPFSLYFMGLLSEEEYDTKYPVYAAGGEGDYNNSAPFNIDSAVPYKEVSIRDIIEVEGPRQCVEI